MSSRVAFADAFRPRGKVAALCSTPRCGWELYVDPIDPRLLDGRPILCEFCAGAKRMCACALPDGGRPTVEGAQPCPHCGRTDQRWDYINERVIVCATGN